MNEYKNGLEKIRKYLLKNDIKDSEECISLYYLYSVLSEKFSLLKVESNDLLNQINSSNIMFRVSKIFPFFDRKKYTTCRAIFVSTEDNVASMTIWFDIPFPSITICKDFDCDDLYFKWDCFNKSEQIIPYQKKILEALFLVEEYAKVLKMDFSCSHSDPVTVVQYSDSVFNISLFISSSGMLNENISFVNPDIENIAKRNWLNQQSLSEVVKSCEEEIFKKISVPVSSLDQSFQDIVLSSFQKEHVLLRKKVN